MLSLLVLALVANEPVLDVLPEGWLQSNAPFGADITFDGHIWINLNRVGQRNDYAALATDLVTKTPDGATVWIRGYHRRNPEVSYRETKTQIFMSCKGRWYSQYEWHAYDADGKVVRSDNSDYVLQTIVPGTVAETWQTQICAKS